MSEVQFEDKASSENGASYKSRAILGDLATPKMVRVAMHFFRFKSEKSAGIFLIWISIVFALLALFFSFKLFYKGSGEVIVSPSLPENIRSSLIK